MRFFGLKKYFQGLNPADNLCLDEVERGLKGDNVDSETRVRLYNILRRRGGSLLETWSSTIRFIRCLREKRGLDEGVDFSEKTCTGWVREELDLKKNQEKVIFRGRTFKVNQWKISSKLNGVEPLVSLVKEPKNIRGFFSKYKWAETWDNVFLKFPPGQLQAGATRSEEMFKRTSSFSKNLEFLTEESFHCEDISILEDMYWRPDWFFEKEDIEADPLIMMFEEMVDRPALETSRLYTEPVGDFGHTESFFLNRLATTSGLSIDELVEGTGAIDWKKHLSMKISWRSLGGFDAKRIDRLFESIDENTMREFCQTQQYSTSEILSGGLFTSRLQKYVLSYRKFYSSFGNRSSKSFLEIVRSFFSNSIKRTHPKDSTSDLSWFEQLLAYWQLPQRLEYYKLRFNHEGLGLGTDYERFGGFGFLGSRFGGFMYNVTRATLLSIRGGFDVFFSWKYNADSYADLYTAPYGTEFFRPKKQLFGSCFEKLYSPDFHFQLQRAAMVFETAGSLEIPLDYVAFTYRFLPTFGIEITNYNYNMILFEYIKWGYWIFWNEINSCIVNAFWRMPDNVNLLLDSYLWFCELPGRMADIGSGWYIVAIFFLVFHFFKAHLTEKFGDIIESFFRQCFGQQMFTLTEATLFVNLILLLWAFKILTNNWNYLGIKNFTGDISPIVDTNGVLAWYPVDSYFFTDGLSLLFVFLTMLIVPLCVLISSGIRFKLELLLKCLIAVELLLILAFSTNNFFVFYLAFEAVLIPMYFIIGLWGSRSERTRASYLFFIYTLAGSVFFLTALVLINTYVGSFNFWIMLENLPNAPWSVRVLLWICLFCGFAFKVPLYPVHSWLTVAHVEAPTAGSVILASLMLKLGGYGLCRFVVALLPDVTLYFQNIVMTVCLVGFVYATVSAYRQLDLKRFVAYTSIAHMHFIILALFTLTDVGYWGSVHSMISHGFISSGLFLLVGSLYDRFGVRNISYYSGLADQMPLFAVFWTVFLFANAGIPFFSGFPGEFCGFVATFTMNPVFGFLLSAGFTFGVIYSVLNISRVIHGSSTFWMTGRSAVDLLDYEYAILVFLGVWVILLGVWPEVVINLLRSTCLF